ncbi:hypothetical protein HMPREF1096_05130 [Enterocloster bolteae 90B7]|nr:hypothetical protein HMPREF1096_05130 [Enterocloster bolteae 90B7]
MALRSIYAQIATQKERMRCTKMQKLWKRYTKLVKQLLSRNTQERSLCGFSGKIILTQIQTSSQTDAKENPNGGLSGLQLIIKRPDLLLGGKITYIGPAQCIWCEEFDNLDMCPGVMNRKECPVVRREITVESIRYSWNGAHECICTINNGELSMNLQKKNLITIEKVEAPWKNFVWPGTWPEA